MTVPQPQPRPRLRRPLDAGPFQPEIGSFRLHLAAEGKAAKTVRIYTGAVQWFAAAHLIPGDDPRRSDVDLWNREISVHGKGGKPRIVRIGYEAARALDRYIRARARHAQAWRPQLWLGTRNRGPLTAKGICQMIARRGRQCGVDVFPHRFRHHGWTGRARRRFAAPIGHPASR